MADSAVVAVAEIRDPPRPLTATIWSGLLLILKAIPALFPYLVRSVRAKLAFHNARRYRELVQRAFELAGLPPASDQLIGDLRKLDRNGLGVWYLAHSQKYPRLQDLCARAIGTPGIGPPRVIARSLERALQGRTVCWFGESGGFDALTAESLISAGLGATLVAWELACAGASPRLDHAVAHLTTTANATQTAVRAHQRVMGRKVGSAEEAVRWIYQALNVLRRAINRTDPKSVEEQLTREAARQALAAAASASSAALVFCETADQTENSPDVTASREKLASLARSVDALTSRVAAHLRQGSVQASSEPLLLDQCARVLCEAAKALRPWSIQLRSEMESLSTTAPNLCDRANELALGSAEVLESWAALHNLLLTQNSSSDSVPKSHSTPPDWAIRLVRTVTKRWTCQDVRESIRRLGGPPAQAVSAAVMIAVLRNHSLPFQRELWKLIRSVHSNNLEKSLAFQLFWRLQQPPPE